MSPLAANTLLLLAGATWGMGFIAQSTAMDTLGPFGFVAARFTVAALVVLPFAWREYRAAGARPAVLWRLSPVGIAFFLGMALQQAGLVWTSVTQAGFLTALYVVLVPVILRVFYRETVPSVVWPAAAASVFGVWLIGGGGAAALNLGDALIIACAVAWAMHVILTGRYGAAEGLPVTMACWQFAIAAGLAAVIHIALMGTPWAEPALDATNLRAASFEILYAGVIAGGFAFTLQAIGQRHTDPAVAAVLLSSESLFAAVLGALILGERLSGLQYSGCALIFVALIAVEWISARREAARKHPADRCSSFP